LYKYIRKERRTHTHVYMNTMERSERREGINS